MAIKAAVRLLFVTVLLSCGCAAQDAVTALWEVALATDSSVVQRHLPTGAVQALSECDPSHATIKGGLFQLPEQMQIDASKRSEGVVSVLDPQHQQTFEIRIARSEVTATKAVFDVLITHKHPSIAANSSSFTSSVTLELEDGEWRVVTVSGTVDGKEQISDLRTMGAKCRKANEQTAIGSMRAINTAQVTYAATYPEIGFARELSRFAQPSPAWQSRPEASGLLDSTFACATQPCVRYGYELRIETAGTTPVTHYKAFARPVAYGKTGTLSFYTDDKGVIRFTTEDRDATAKDPTFDPALEWSVR